MLAPLLVPLRSLCPAGCTTAEVGGKAMALGRLAVAGFPVPEGFCVTARALHILCAGTELAQTVSSDASGERAEVQAALARAVDRLPGEVAVVRSSASCEDQEVASAAGLFLSLCTERDSEAVRAGLQQVLASLRSPAALAYLQRHGQRAEAVSMAAVVQPWIVAEVGGVVYTRDPAAPASPCLRIESRQPRRPGSLAQPGEVSAVLLDRDTLAVRAILDRLPRGLEPEELQEIARLALRVETALGGPQDIEWLLHRGVPCLVQARPISALPTQRPRFASPVEQAAMEQQAGKDACWTWDRVHNPEPLSPAQTGLVELVERLTTTGLRQRVLRGYLYSARDSAGPPPRRIAPAQLAEVWSGELRPHLEALLCALEEPVADPSRLLEPALAGLVKLFACYLGEIGPALGATRQALEDLLPEIGEGSPAGDRAALATWLAGSGSPARERLRALAAIADTAIATSDAGLGSYLDRYGAFSPAWDVLYPTYAEDPRPVLAAALALCRQHSATGERAQSRAPGESAARLGAGPPTEHLGTREPAAAAGSASDDDQLASLLNRLPPARRQAAADLLHAARAAATIREQDDLYFARAQAAVRRALCACGSRLTATGVLASADDVFFLDLAWVRAWLRGETSDEGQAAARAAHARKQWQRQRTLVPPLRIVGGQEDYDLPAGSAPAVLRGHGQGGRARGPAHLLGSGGSTATPGTVTEVADSANDSAAAFPDGCVLICAELLPAQTVLLPRAVGLCTDQGGLLDHGATHARELGLPCVVGTRHATRTIPEGAMVVVDGVAGLVYLDCLTGRHGHS